MIKYCASVFKTLRRATRQVMVGQVGIGGNNPIRIQSMTTSATQDVAATIDQIMRLADEGCEIVRVTVQGMKEAEACEKIKSGLLQRNYFTPLVADIHFFPPAAMRAVEFVDKVRINPGNYADKRAIFKRAAYDDNSYAKEIEKIEGKFLPLVEKCKKLMRPIRIGVNHGSLSDRIMNRYGDTPRGMIESALEFATICRKHDFHDIIFSMKSSNTHVMVAANRLLAAKMVELDWDYPLHLGVTEAGQGEDGRIKSAVGIGALLLDGLGDTIRVSLTEDAWHEIEPCKSLIAFAQYYQGKGVAPFTETQRAIRIEDKVKRAIDFPSKWRLHKNGHVIVSASLQDLQDPQFYAKMGLGMQFGKPVAEVATPDSIFLSPGATCDEKVEKELRQAGLSFFSLDGVKQTVDTVYALKEIDGKTPTPHPAILIQDEPLEDWLKLEAIQPGLILLSPEQSRLHYARHFFEWLIKNKMKCPVILAFSYKGSKQDILIQSAAEYGALLCDGLGDGIWLRSHHGVEFCRSLSFHILQACRMRSFKTEFISCPSCGRTLFDLQKVTQRIKEKTAHLPGVKIAIMGCIVNGPGEMADADFGYVGSKPHKIDLYVGKQCVEKDVDDECADSRLIDLIKKHGRWVEPQSQSFAQHASLCDDL